MKEYKKGIFVVLEGIDGAGKGTAIQGLKEEAQKAGLSFLLTKEPTDGQIGKLIRDKLEGRSPMISAIDFQLLFNEDRLDHVEKVIRPALEKCDLVICDRYWLSTLAYGIPRLKSEEMVRLRGEVFKGNFLKPDINFILDLSVETAIQRIQINRTRVDFFEKVDKLQKIRQTYLDLREDADFGKTILIDAEKSPKEIVSQIWETISKMLIER